MFPFYLELYKQYGISFHQLDILLTRSRSGVLVVNSKMVVHMCKSVICEPSGLIWFQLLSSIRKINSLQTPSLDCLGNWMVKASVPSLQE